MPEIISRATAKARGLKWYFHGKPCRHGHICQRLVSNKTCFVCERAARHRRYLENEKPYRRWDTGSAYAIKDNERTRNRRKKIGDLIAVLRSEMPELLREFEL